MPHSDPRDGLALGGYANLINMDPKGRSRSYVAIAYYLPASKRPNLKVITGALVEKVLLKTASQSSGLIAIGAQYNKNATSSQVQAKREVILSAGSIGSPHVLELSGIGNSNLLSKYGISVAINNENVGENLQDHIYVPIGYEVISGVPTLDDFKNSSYFNDAYEEYIANATGPLATTGASSGLLSCPQIGCAHLNPAEEIGNWTSPGLVEQYRILSKYFQTEAVTQELTVTGGMSPQYVNDTTKLFTTTIDGNFFTMLGVLEHPFSRGSVHIQSSDPAAYPQIDPRYLSNPFDLKVLGKIALHLQEVAKTAPLSDLLKANGTVYQPGYFKLDGSNVDKWVRQYLQSEYHPAGTCAMMPRHMGGVVDAKFKLYGAENIRVVDASVFPLLPRGNLQTLVYALAERAADWIKEDAGS
ncbi:GMC oxidoreductase [Glonium stellatum]|uniref:GMC oxidoreductase n=1 Tax=Glonium stellatum TaxID=574774 RepID=A0A8E2F4U6_9PEZI|nr:GMC oxidoreductase [Glonium stellatum]